MSEKLKKKLHTAVIRFFCVRISSYEKIESFILPIPSHQRLPYRPVPILDSFQHGC